MQKTKPHRMIPMFHSYLEQFSADDPQAVIGRQGRIFMEICKPKKVTRKQLAEDFNLRPGTVSALALQLINRGLVEEFRPSPPYQMDVWKCCPSGGFAPWGHRIRLIFPLAAVIKIFIVI